MVSSLLVFRVWSEVRDGKVVAAGKVRLTLEVFP